MFNATNKNAVTALYQRMQAKQKTLKHPVAHKDRQCAWVVNSCTCSANHATKHDHHSVYWIGQIARKTNHI